ncbi:MAG: hypothetical protein NTZ49_05740 [Candidatus Parcubacteria bacterium]|nr:hypothetical protein [Candidatus Parcubacteria bacterium]
MKGKIFSSVLLGKGSLYFLIIKLQLMKQNKIISLGAVAIALIAVIGMAGASYAASAVSQDNTVVKAAITDEMRSSKKEMDAKRAEMETKMKAIESALAANDYNAWVTAVGADSDEAKKVTADKFSLLIQAYNLEQEAKAKFDQAKQIRENLGLTGPESGKKFGPHKGRGPVRGLKLEQAPSDGSQNATVQSK